MTDPYTSWSTSPFVDEDMKQQLQAMSLEERQDAFYQNLEFGTGGMRGVLGPGTNRLNLLTVRRAARGIAQYIETQGEAAKQRGFVIAFDNRRMSKEFSREVASVVADAGVRVYLYEEPRTTPQLSYSVRALNTFMGMMITASHNPPEYNGLKVYGEDGAQLNLEDAKQVVDVINQLDGAETLEPASFQTYLNSGRIQFIGEKLDQEYQQQVKTVVFDKELFQTTDLRVVFTPLHGASGGTVRLLMEDLGITNRYFVESQMEPDPEFPTVVSANPEDHSAFEKAMELGAAKQAELLIAVDPDGDRVGLAVRDGQEYKLLNGNETGALALHFVLSQHQQRGTLPSGGVAYKTIVTSELGRVIAESFGVEMEDVLTGFKFIGEKIRENEANPDYTFLFGYEESYGYLAKPFARDKDAVQLVVLLVEMAAHYKQKGMTLLDALDALYTKYGAFKEKLISVTVKGAGGAKQIKHALEDVRKNPPEAIAGISVEVIEDYLSQVRKSQQGSEKLHLPEADVIKFMLTDGTWVCLRPSGTEPKVKYYIGVRKDSKEQALKNVEIVSGWVESWMKTKLEL
ncbi:phosphoglucomutase [Chryseomicrobium excrementi]|uniref:Phosphoglucomutase n=1 Tax=Chryseomicrobium excrementi TaxID=2041346 RepID=A0A2M9F0Z6_9BACL|nr:phospho-sugar mutase [Chryseomicrobium excrementi]PJK17134.1 phosphoglucomutase [Chryseomicrobium excrementi]